MVASRRSLRRAMVVVAVVVTLWSALAIGARASDGGRTTADEPQYLLSAISLGEDADLDIGDERADDRYRAFHEAPLPRQELVLRDGRQVSPHDPLLPAVLALPVALGGWVAAKATLAVMGGALAASMLWVAVHRFAVPLGVAVLAVLAYGLAAPLAFYGTQVYPELPAALVVTLVIAAITGPLQGRGIALLGAGVTALPWLAVKYVPVAAALAALGLCRLARRGRARSAGALTAALVVAGLAYLGSHHAVYGGWTAYAAGDHFVGGETTAVGVDPDYVGRSRRVLGLLVDRDFGLAAWQPGYLLAVPALAALARRRPSGWQVLLAPLVVGWLTATFVALTMHGWWWPGRQTVVVLPAVVLAVAWWAGQVRAARAWLAAALVAGAITYLVVVVETLAGRRTLIVDLQTTTNPLSRAWRLVLPDYQQLDTTAWALHATWLIAVSVLAWIGWRSLSSAPREQPVPSSHRVQVMSPAPNPWR